MGKVELRHVCFLLGGRWTKHLPKVGAPRGQPHKVWHAVAREFARAVEKVLRELGHDKGLNPKNEASATAVICASALTWAYGAKIGPAAVSNAMRSRNRKAKAKASLEFDAMHPGLRGRIKVD